MSGTDGAEPCREIRQRAAEPHIDILLATVKGQLEEITHGKIKTILSNFCYGSACSN